MGDAAADRASVANRAISNTACDEWHQAHRHIGYFAVLDFGVGDTRTNRQPIALNPGMAQLDEARDINKFSRLRQSPIEHRSQRLAAGNDASQCRRRETT